MSYKEELDRIKEALDYALFGCSDDNANTEKHFNTLQNALIAVDRIKKSQSNLLDQKIDEEGNVLESPEEHLSCDMDYGASWVELNEEWKQAPTLRQEREELKRLKEENEKLVNSVGEWSALAIDRKQDLDEANKKNQEGREALNDIVWLIERGASMDEIKESVNAKARPFLITNKTK